MDAAPFSIRTPDVLGLEVQAAVEVRVRLLGIGHRERDVGAVRAVLVERAAREDVVLRAVVLAHEAAQIAAMFVPARVGHARAAEMAMLGERIPAPKALEWGLINRVAADEDFERDVDALAHRLASGPTGSYAGTKRQLNAWLYGRMDEQLALEADIQQESAETGDFIEGVTAFVEKRPPSFGGS